MHEKLDWAECDEEVQEFAKNKILKHVFDTEFAEKPYPFHFLFKSSVYVYFEIFYKQIFDVPRLK